ncbi:hypothetical protein Y032_0061g3273 [Ancylostoma ceylanicum]|uniref:SCP domain-containing protein n=1 Tax=Ancylostoma ceylanicum TaxID=53326 RepID=A0A016U2F8_9BILA|nr:hypothetical protein Y032_0061g3273 [Ancylostoma ceylanicum]
MCALLIATLLAFLLPSTASVELKCQGGKALKEQAEQVEKSIGDRRWLLIQGKQKNGPNGGKMPMPEQMDEVRWNCSLEKEAIDLIGGACSGDVPTTDYRTILLTSVTGETRPPFESALTVWTTELDRKAMRESAIGDDSVTYQNDIFLLDYLNLVRANLTGIGCAQTTCSLSIPSHNNAKKSVVLCLTNEP